MRYFYDMEFIEDGKTIDLISIGMVAEDGREFYAVSDEFNMDKLLENTWLVDNVLPSLPLGLPWNGKPRVSGNGVMSRAKIRQRLKEFMHVKQAHEHPIQLWAYYGAYDHIALCQLWGKMMDLPEGMPMFTNDIMQAFTQHRSYGNRNFELPRQLGTVHNALEDARHTRDMWKSLREDGARLSYGV